MKPRARTDASWGTDQLGTQDVTIGRPQGDDKLAEFWLFPNEVHALRPETHFSVSSAKACKTGMRPR